MAEQDPIPVINLYRVLTFVMMLLSGLTAFSVVPAAVAPWLSLAAFVVSTGLTVFFNGASVTQRVVNATMQKLGRAPGQVINDTNVDDMIQRH
jgi:hypothetical protein